jgi:putative spermidine/putrescine transport system permease protein
MQALNRHIHPGWLIIAPLMLMVVALYLGPILNILWLSVTDPEPGFGNYAKLAEGDALIRIVWTTVRICIITTLFSVIFGYSIAYAMVHCHQRQKVWLPLAPRLREASITL